ncbi:hypothetical protein pv_301 [Pithovirus sibericum]|uniref:F-box domain-containing protein n=1 Tax=Pithovirus sibericum TaxID=1450746 RepID=W5S525_9VIRU|nr:hypothetical protein pv_301 [Pithovirus sibericum]AHH01868.1 hypothetical protein pv_301 [Pithovirus sibericum]
MNFFQSLPDEINVQILSYLNNFSDFRKVNKIRGLAHILNWQFWRKKSLQDFKVSFWYFDLPIQQNRKLTGEQRFLEIHSKFKLIPESLARIENGRVEGIYNDTAAKSICENRKDVEFLSYLTNRKYPAGRYETIKLEKVASEARLKKIGICRSTHRLINTRLLFNDVTEYDEYMNEAERILYSSEDFNPNQEPLYYCPPLVLLVRGSALAFRGREQDFPFVKEVFINSNQLHRNIILNFTLISRNTKHFIQLWELNPPVNTEFREFLYHTAYFCANIEAISFLQSQGISPSFSLSIQCLAMGFAFDPHPVEVYQILQEAKRGKFSTLDFCHEAFRIDLDIRILLNLPRERENCLTDFNSDVRSLRYFALIEFQSTNHFFDRHAHSSIIRKKIYQELGIPVKFTPKKKFQGIPPDFLECFLKEE